MPVSILLASAALVAALQSSATIDQVPSLDGQRTKLIDENVRNLQVENVPQVSKTAGEPRDPTQLTVEKSGKAVDQLGPRDRGTQSAENLSAREQGFDTKVVKLEGTDKCSLELLSSRDREYCQRVIENRSAEYTGPKEPALSPEQELLAKRNPKLIDGGTDGAIKRLVNNRDSADDADTQAIASTVFTNQSDAAQTAPELPAENDLSAETQALIDAIVKNVAGNPGS
jgi:hypothetical protein